MFDAIVIGSGMSGGMAAKELSERGLKTLVLERGPEMVHGASYTDWMQPWDLNNANLVSQNEIASDYAVQGQCYAFTDATKHYWVKDSEHPYSTPPDKPFAWFRGYHLGGRSIMWGRQTYRLSEMDFEANRRDGQGADWPIRYDDIAPWYDHVERFIGVSGTNESLPQLPDGQFLPPFGLTDAELDFASKVEARFPGRRVIPGRCAHLTETRPQHEELGRSRCQSRSLCGRGCTYGAYYSSLSASLPAARRTGNCTIQADAIVHSIIYDPATRKVSGVRVINAVTGETRTYESRVVFLCASAIPTAQILLNSASDAFPRGLANSSDMVGRNLMDHLMAGVYGIYPGFEDRFYRGRRPTGFYVPRFRNISETEGFLRGYGYQGGIMRAGWNLISRIAGGGVGADLKARLRKPGPWIIFLSGFGEMLPRQDNRVTLHPTKTDKWGMPQAHIECSHGENDLKLAGQMIEDAKSMLSETGGEIIAAGQPNPPGEAIHEMGTACMGKDPAMSVLNKYNQAHDIPNLFITDGSAMASSGCQNPSLTYMALSARAAHHAAEFLKEGKI